MMESFFKTLKVERVDRTRYSTREQGRLDIVDWIQRIYIRVRMHSSISYQAPARLESSRRGA